MTNREILEAEMTVHAVEEEVNTFAGWKREGRIVKKGEKAVFKTKIWKPRKTKEADSDKNPGMIMVNAHYFTISQTQEKA